MEGDARRAMKWTKLRLQPRFTQSSQNLAHDTILLNNMVSSLYVGGRDPCQTSCPPRNDDRRRHGTSVQF